MLPCINYSIFSHTLTHSFISFSLHSPFFSLPSSAYLIVSAYQQISAFFAWLEFPSICLSFFCSGYLSIMSSVPLSFTTCHSVCLSVSPPVSISLALPVPYLSIYLSPLSVYMFVFPFPQSHLSLAFPSVSSVCSPSLFFLIPSIPSLSIDFLIFPLLFPFS